MTQDNQHEADNPVVIAQEDSIKADYIPTNNQPSTGIMVTSTSMETPFLPPQFLDEYEKTVPGSAKQIFDMIVKQQEFNMNIKNQEMDLNRQNLERIKVIDNANIKEQEASALVREKEIQIKSRGQIFALIMGLVLLAVACYFAWLGHLKLAGLTIGIIVAVMTILFLQQRHNQNSVDSKAE